MHPVLESLRGVVKAADPDRALQLTVASLIEACGMRYALGKHKERWEPGKPLKLLAAGYVGTRNTGADVRVEEMLRQFRHIIGDDDLELTVMTNDAKLSAGYFRACRQVEMPVVFPKFLFDECPKHHGVIACEGSMFKSKFASALTCMMAGSLGMANAENKVSIGYGAEAGEMTEHLRDFVAKVCKHSLVICRNEPSRDVLEDLGIRTTSGADTAWTFDPGPLEIGERLLRKAGWDGKKKVVAIAAINPFWWPVKPDLVKAAAWRLTGEYKREHYRSIYFHESSKDRDDKLEAYLGGIASAVDAFRQERDVFPVMIGMEKLDRGACQAISDRLGGVPMFISDEHDMYEMVSVLRNCGMLISSRFHAIVTSMPGLLPSGGITMDERIRNLMNDRGHPELFLEVDEDGLEDKVLALLRTLDKEGERIAGGIARAIPRQLELMGQMGIDFMDEVVRVYPELPRRDLPRTWEAHLPPLPEVVGNILQEHG